VLSRDVAGASARVRKIRARHRHSAVHKSPGDARPCATCQRAELGFHGMMLCGARCGNRRTRFNTTADSGTIVEPLRWPAPTQTTLSGANPGPLQGEPGFAFAPQSDSALGCLLLSLLEHPSQLVIEFPICIEIPGDEGSHHVSFERSDFLSVRARMNLDPLPRLGWGCSVPHGKCLRRGYGKAMDSLSHWIPLWLGLGAASTIGVAPSGRRRAMPEGSRSAAQPRAGDGGAQAEVKGGNDERSYLGSSIIL